MVGLSHSIGGREVGVRSMLMSSSRGIVTKGLGMAALATVDTLSMAVVTATTAQAHEK